MDAFKDKISERAQDTNRPSLAHQGRGRELSSAELDLVSGLMKVYETGEHDFEKVVQGLAAKGVTAPISGRTDWTVDLLSEELTAINADLDAAYAEHGFGA